MNSFYVTFSSDTKASKMTAGIKAVATEWTQDDTTFRFETEWGTSKTDLENLKGRIESKSGRHSVSAIDEDDGSSSDSDGKSS